MSHHDLGREEDRGVQKISELKLVMGEMTEFLVNECGDEVRTQYETCGNNVDELTKCFEIAKNIFLKENKTRRVAQMSWESFVKDARRVKKERLGKVTRTRAAVARPAAVVRQRAVARPAARPAAVVRQRAVARQREVAKKKAAPKRKAAPRRNTVAKRNAAPKTNTVAKRQRNIALSSTSTSSRFHRRAAQMNNSQATSDFGQTFGNAQEKVTKLRRNAAGCFETVKCSECKVINTNHRCTYEVFKGGFMDGNKRICGVPFCRICAGARACEDGSNRCRDHM